MDIYIYIYISEGIIYKFSNIIYKSLVFKFETIRDCTCIDFFYKKYRFNLFYNFCSYKYNYNLLLIFFVKILLNYPYSKGIYSLIKLYKSMNWLEREIWDLFGIFFKNHVDFRRILTDYGFYGFPLRKDFPLMGYYEIRYDDFDNIIIKEKLQIVQNYRLYEYTNTYR